MRDQILKILQDKSFDFQYSGYANEDILTDIIVKLNSTNWEEKIKDFQIDENLTAEQNAQILLDEVGSELLSEQETNWSDSVTFCF